MLPMRLKWVENVVEEVVEEKVVEVVEVEEIWEKGKVWEKVVKKENTSIVVVARIAKGIGLEVDITNLEAMFPFPQGIPRAEYCLPI